MNVTTINEFDTGLEFEELTDKQINEVSGGLIPLVAAGIYWGAGLAGFGIGFSVGQAIWGD